MPEHTHPEHAQQDDVADILSADIVMETTDLRVSRLTLAPDGVVPWHRHTEIADHFVCLSGRIEITTCAPDTRIVDNSVSLGPGEEFRAEAGTPHRVRNLNATETRFLVVQGVGAYDRFAAPPEGEPSKDPMANSDPR